ncbi:MAG: hypothetical protein FJ144_20565 [Deltaproteobacteria bacterium]|nr:hypothetical protein [Deltaproteobacteria bacterium]
MNAALRKTATIAASGFLAATSLLGMASRVGAQLAGEASLANVSTGGAQANADSWSVATSADGTLVAFASQANNLVPLDNNGDTDVFLHDTVSGITSRVSVNYQGEEATGDSDCPSMSADGRYVAFASSAWNMAQGGQHLETPVWEVYLHDRQGPSTVRVSTPIGGGAGTGDSGCPAISADGSHVAFSSRATDLVPDDTNGVADVFVYDVASGSITRASVSNAELQSNGPSYAPSLSGDGSVVAFTSEATNLTPASPVSSWPIQQVYARDLGAETTELVSRAFLAPVVTPNGWAWSPRISDDGNVVLFASNSGNLLVDTNETRPFRLYVRNRATDETEAVEPLSFGPGPCGWLPEPLICDTSSSKGAALSADGRFVAFLSGSHSLLPENPPMHRDQIYLQDRLTRRLRRVTVDPTGYPINAFPCGGSSSTLSLSADGGVLAFVGDNASALGLPEANQTADRDIVRLDLTCDPDGRGCREISACPGTPATGCEPAQKALLRIRKNPPLSTRGDRFAWRWIGAGEGKGQAQSFVDPTQGGDYQLCVYAGESLHAQIDAGIPTGAPWQKVGRGWSRKDPRGALELVRLRKGSARSMVTIASSSAAIDLPYLPLEVPQGLTVQLQETTSGRCWESAFPATDIGVNRRGEVTPEGILPGSVHATIDYPDPRGEPPRA